MSDDSDLEKFQKTIGGWICPERGRHVRCFLVKTDLEKCQEIPLADIWRICQ
jgi:hypothetical protein